MEALEGCIQDKEKLSRHVNRQLAHIRKELTVLSGRAHDLAERTRREMGRIDTSIRSTLTAFQIEDSVTGDIASGTKIASTKNEP